MRVALAGGGTGGHVYPALAVAERLHASGDVDLVYYGTSTGLERGLVEAAGIPFRSVPAAQLRVRAPWLVARGLLRLWQGTREARRMLRQDRPNVLFATGGYAAAPIGRAAKQAGVPLIVFLPDAHPGWAVKFLARYATTIACAVDQAVDALPEGRTVVTGYPLRAQFATATAEDGHNAFSLDASLPTVLVTGGSQGARAINQAVAEALPRWLAEAQVIHVCGPNHLEGLEARRADLSEEQRGRYHLFGYTEEMAPAMAASDLAVMRAGASTLGELSVTGLPAVLVPGAYSDQAVNADYLASRGAAVHLPESRIEDLTTLVLDLLRDTPRREAMAEAMRALARPDAAERLAALVRDVATKEAAA
ncbi:MAG: undecaprenyldiphospho-muramoylpentapeptide beta-N-acetylglucosaminyltransferase [Dehalococcoidia bacterium]|nr:undecaprenyldiphospho-muramoylpentapeptide beta-N-acetylglucosaminyltransferase [Dehalococcoidia bacterium]